MGKELRRWCACDGTGEIQLCKDGEWYYVEEVDERIEELENDLKMAYGCTVHEELICVQSQIEHERKEAEALGKKIHRTHKKRWLGALDAIRNEIEK